MALTFDTSHVKTRLSELVGRVAYGRERVVVLRRGRPMAALVNVEDHPCTTASPSSVRSC
jgi:prevent-host-death family protein